MSDTSFNSSNFAYEEGNFTSGEGNFTNSTTNGTSTENIQSNVSIYTPVTYIITLLVLLATFSSFYRKRKVNKLRSMSSLFGENIPKEMYLQLKAQEEPKVNEKLLKTALIRRGAEAVRRLFKLKECEPYMNILYLKGYIGDEDHERMKIQKKLIEVELSEVAMEAESYKKGWSQQLFPVCQETTMNEALRRRLNAIKSREEKLGKEWTVEEINIGINK